MLLEDIKDFEGIADRANTEIVEESGGFESDCPLTSLFYDLLRDEISPGRLQHLVTAAICHNKSVKYTNGWLARYANYLASQFRPTNVNTNVDG